MTALPLPLHLSTRPKLYDQVVGQDQVIRLLQGGFNNKRTRSVYILHGCHGTGKTTVARLLAKSYLCTAYTEPTATPCGKCDSCLAVDKGHHTSVFEENAAANNGVDYARELVSRSHLRLGGSKYRIVILDEAHRLTKQAQDVLLKTLESTPSGAVFIFCTTDPSQLIPTVHSRAQSFGFRPLPKDKLVSYVKQIATQEEIDISDAAINAIYDLSGGSVRDALTLLDKLAALGQITAEDVFSSEGVLDACSVARIVTAIEDSNTGAALMLLRNIVYDPQAVLVAVLTFYRDLVYYSAVNSFDACSYPESLLSTFPSNIERYASQVAILNRDSLSTYAKPQYALEGRVIECCIGTPVAGKSDSEEISTEPAFSWDSLVATLPEDIQELIEDGRIIGDESGRLSIGSYTSKHNRESILAAVKPTYAALNVREVCYAD